MKEFDSDFLDQQFLTAMRAGDYLGAVRFFKERTREALLDEEEEAVGYASDILIASLTAAGPDQEALDLVYVAVDSYPGEIYLRSSLAGYLLSFLIEPSRAMEVLEPALDELMAEEGSRHATLGLYGAILCALSRREEAERCLIEMLQSPLRRMYPGAIDFRLVEALIQAGWSKEACEQYLTIAREVAKEANDIGVMERSEHLLRLLQHGP
jgi:tetratricopeptide (TPR) repeat protein